MIAETFEVVLDVLGLNTGTTLPGSSDLFWQLAGLAWLTPGVVWPGSARARMSSAIVEYFVL